MVRVPSGSVGRSAGVSRERVSVSDAAVIVLQRPGLHQLEERRGSPGHQQDHHLPEAGPFNLAGLAGLPGAAHSVGWTLEAGQHFEVDLVLAGRVPIGVAAAGLGAVAEGPSLQVIKPPEVFSERPEILGYARRS